MLRLIALGHTNAEIAEQLFLSVRTVETHRSHIQQKLRLSTRAELVGYALERGLINTAADSRLRLAPQPAHAPWVHACAPGPMSNRSWASRELEVRNSTRSSGPSLRTTRALKPSRNTSSIARSSCSTSATKNGIPALLGDHRQAFDQQGPKATAVEVVRYLDRDFGMPRVQDDKGGVSDDPPASS